jgi:3-hydroxyacyl-CoA dehydrogenase
VTTLVHTRRDDDVLIITIDHPPVNALSHAVRTELSQALDAVDSDPTIRGVVLSASGTVFVGGSDIKEFGAPRQPPLLSAICDRIEAMRTPVVAALNGAALGGGFELALAAHARIASPSVEVALPEVLLGLMPGAGGTQRTTRLAGPSVSLQLMLGGQRMSATDALSCGLLDRVTETVLSDTTELVRSLASSVAPLRRSRAQRAPGTREEHVAAIAAARESIATTSRRLFSPARIVDAVEMACLRDEGTSPAEEAALFQECVSSPQSKALIHLFFAEREVAKGSGNGVQPRALASVGVVGGGTMGVGIVLALLDAGLTVTLVEQDDVRRANARETIVASYEALQRKGRVVSAVVAERLSRLTCSTDLAALQTVDLVLEAVVEDLAVKQALFTRLAQMCKPRAVLATTTSHLDVASIAAASDRVRDVIGLHFFSPAQITKLVEVVVPTGAGVETVATGFALAKRLRKIAVRSGVCDGFIGNRMLAVYREAAENMVADGASPYDIDAALREFGFAMGPFEMTDLVGGAIARATRKRRAAVSPRHLSPEAIVEQYLAAMINEGARVVGDRIAQRPLDVDVVLVHGYGFPRERGGPMHYADQAGTGAWLSIIQRLSHDDAFYWQPAPLLVSLAERDAPFHSLNR